MSPRRPAYAGVVAEQTIRRPHPALAGLLAAYHGYHHVIDEHAVHHGLPGTSATLIIAFDEPLDVGWLDRPASRDAFWCMAGGLHTRPALIRTHGHQHGIQIDLAPAGARALLGLPIGALATELVHHDDLPVGIPARLRERLATTPDWGTRFDLLDAHLLGLLHSPRPRARPETAEAWRLIQATHGAVRTAELARQVGWSERHLRSLFAAEYGVTPKQAARLARFERARALAIGGLGWAAVAQGAGYAEQAHLAREWRDFAGLTPTETLADPLRIVQDEEPGRLASSSA